MLAGEHDDAVHGRQGQIKMRNLIRYSMRWMVPARTRLWDAAFAVVLASAQGAAIVELGADYNYVRANAPPDGCGCFSMHGANAWFAYNVTQSFAVVAEVSSQRASDISGSGEDLTLTSYLFGPRYSWHQSGHFAPFARSCWAGRMPAEALPRTVLDLRARPTPSP